MSQRRPRVRQEPTNPAQLRPGGVPGYSNYGGGGPFSALFAPAAPTAASARKSRPSSERSRVRSRGPTPPISVEGGVVNTIAPTPAELLILSGHGIRIGLIGHYGLFVETPTFDIAVKAARVKLAAGDARSFVAIRIEAMVIDGIGDGTERELVRFEVYPDRVALVPVGQGGLSDAQKAKAHALRKKGLL